MPELAETIFAPELEGGEWLQQGPVRIQELRGRAVVLLDFWDYTCVNCVRTLPYIKQWHNRYAQHGLVIIGVHAPEFAFARERTRVAQAIADFGLEYPIVLDNDYRIWRAYSNRYWPAKYLVDAQGGIRYFHFGEGAYGETEAGIQRLLRELNPGLELPPPMQPVRDSDLSGALCYRVTPELYVGYARGQFGSPEGIMRDHAHDYRDPGRHMEGVVYLDGRWHVAAEYTRAESPGAEIRLRYTAKDVNLVLAPPSQGPGRIELKLARRQEPGADAKSEDGRMVIAVEHARMYNLVANSTVRAGSLELIARSPGVEAYAFTFTSCEVS